MAASILAMAKEGSVVVHVDAKGQIARFSQVVAIFVEAIAAMAGQASAGPNDHGFYALVDRSI